MTTKHTPGPWTNNNGSINARWETGEQVQLCATLTTTWCGDEAMSPKNTRIRNESKANAKLIAAAPDLLDVVRRYSAGMSWEQLFPIAQAALAKARGAA